MPAVQLGILGMHRRKRPSEPAVALRARLALPRMLGWALLEVLLAALAFAARPCVRPSWRAMPPRLRAD